MIYLIIYLITILLLLYVDAMLAIAFKYEFTFFSSAFICALFPITIPIIIVFAAKKTKGLRSADEIIYGVKK